MPNIEVHKNALKKALPFFGDALPLTAKKILTPERIVQVTCTAISKSPMLMKCTPQSILKAVMDCVQVGLEPGGPMGHAYLVPFYNKSISSSEATPIVGYKGHIQLAMRSGLFKGPPAANLVYDDDSFSLDLGSGRPPKHTFDLRKSISDRGHVLGAYCTAAFKDGGYHIEWMSIDQIDAVMNKSLAKTKGSGPWRTDTGQMQRKTVIRRASNYWPMSVCQAQAFDMDNRAESGEDRDESIAYGAEFLATLDEIKAESADGPGGQDRSSDVALMIRSSIE